MVRDANVNAEQRVSNSLTRSFIDRPQCYKQREEHLACEICSKITTTFSYKAFEVGNRRLDVDFFC